jgi:hypothetical protein
MSDTAVALLHLQKISELNESFYFKNNDYATRKSITESSATTSVKTTK